MGTAPPKDPPTLVKEFCHQCNWAFACWIAHRRIFDDNSNKKLLDRIAPNFNEYLWRISQVYCYQQICKLHDPAESPSRNMTSCNLTIDYVTRYVDWGEDKKNIEQLADKLKALYKRLNLSPARNKVIAHNDLDVLLRGEPVGGCHEGLDKEYFQCLQEFASHIYEKVLKGHYSFKDMNHVMDGAFEYLGVLERSDRAN
jgi:hypothetical protein